MALIDLSESQLEDYRPEREEPDDFDEFWRRTLAETRTHPLDAVFEPYPTAMREIEVFDVTFSGWAGNRIKGWFLRPRRAEGPLPCVVEYIGYNCGRATPYQWLTMPSAGWSTLVMDNRGQGGWLPGDTPDVEPEPIDWPGGLYLTRGLASPNGHYYRRLMSDAVRAVEVAREHPLVDSERIALNGGSQGGGLALTVGGLVEGLSAVVAQAPFLCYYRRAAEATNSHPYFEITRYLRTNPDRAEQAMRTLSYFDAVNHSARITAPTLVTVPMMDDICPPSTTMAAYYHCKAEKELKIWPYGDHGGGETHAARAALEFLSPRLN